FSRPSDPIDALLILVESVVEKWTPAQAGVIVKLLKGKTMSEAAKALNISQSAVSQHAQAAKWWAIEPVIKTFDQLLKPYYHHVCISGVINGPYSGRLLFSAHALGNLQKNAALEIRSILRTYCGGNDLFLFVTGQR